jgi:hypothetical protein
MTTLAAPPMIGPDVRKLIASKAALLMIPPGTQNGLATAIGAFTKPGNVVAVTRQATEWVQTAIRAVKEAPDNPYGDDDEAIAGEILRQVSSRRGRPATLPVTPPRT